MADYTSTHTGVELDDTVTDLTALFSAGGLDKNLVLQNNFQLQGKQVGGTARRLVSMDTGDKIHIGQTDDIILQSANVLISSAGVATGVADVSADDLVIDGLSNRGLTIIAANTGFSQIAFGDPDDSISSQIQHNHNTDAFSIKMKSVEAINVDVNANVSVANGDFEIEAGQLLLGTPESLTITSGAVTATRTFVKLSPEGGAGSDDLTNIAVPPQGDGALLILRSFSGVSVIVLKDGVGNLVLAGDFSLTSSGDKIILIFDNNVWSELSRSNNA